MFDERDNLTPDASGPLPAPMTRREAMAREQNRRRPVVRQKTPPTSVPQRRPAPERSQRPRRRLRELLGLTMVAGIVSTVVLPAYAFGAGGHPGGSSSVFLSAQQQAQGLSVSGGAAGQSTSNDVYTSQSGAQVAAARIQALRLSGSWVPPYQSAGDDYPWWNKRTEYSGGGLSPLGYYYRECVDFVAWRLNRDVGSTGAPWRYEWHTLASGSAWVWLSEWRSKGWPVSDRPVPGAVAWFPYNHVAYVKSVNADGSANLEEYNWTGDHLYHTRTIAASDATYLYPPG